MHQFFEMKELLAAIRAYGDIRVAHAYQCCPEEECLKATDRIVQAAAAWSAEIIPLPVVDCMKDGK